MEHLPMIASIALFVAGCIGLAVLVVIIRLKPGAPLEPLYITGEPAEDAEERQ